MSGAEKEKGGRGHLYQMCQEDQEERDGDMSTEFAIRRSPMTLPEKVSEAKTHFWRKVSLDVRSEPCLLLGILRTVERRG